MARKQALKVFRTPIGFHDAYVAAPSQKAALAAWGSSADLFARGVAERVTDEALMREPLASPGKIVRRLREGDADALAEGDTPKRKKSAGRAKAKPPAKPRRDPGPRPSRADLAAAEEALDQLRSQQAREEADLRERERRSNASGATSTGRTSAILPRRKRRWNRPAATMRPRSSAGSHGRNDRIR